MGAPRNVLIFCTDEMRADHMACMGNPVVNTPNLDRLAARGTVFRRAYCNNPICMPARATMFTGLLPRDHGVRVNGQNLRCDLPVLPAVLREHGYRTHASGKLHLTSWVPKVEPPDPKRFPECLAYWKSGAMTKFPDDYYGFDTVDFVGGHSSWAYGDYLQWLQAAGGDPAMLAPGYALDTPSGAPSCFKMSLPEELHYNRYIADTTIRAIQETSPEQPFFVWCSFPDPHVPLGPPAPYCHMYEPDDMPLPARREGELADLPDVYAKIQDGCVCPNGSSPCGTTDAQWREMIAMTYGMITHLDAEVGRVFDALEADGRLANTLIVFTTDHGDMMGDHNLIWKAFYTFRGCIQIPMIVAAPGCPGGQQVDALVSQVDLLPSVLDWCDVPLPGKAAEEIETPFERGSLQPLERYPGRSWLPLVQGEEAPVRDRVIIENDDPTTGYQVRCLVTERYRLSIYPGADDGELFDLQEDPDELLNLWYRAECRSLRQGLSVQLLDGYAAETPWHPIPPWNS